MKNDLRARREAGGWTQAQLADALDVSRQTVNALETGRYDPSLPLAFRIADLFDTTIERIFDPERAPARTRWPGAPGPVILRDDATAAGGPRD